MLSPGDTRSPRGIEKVHPPDGFCESCKLSGVVASRGSANKMPEAVGRKSLGRSGFEQNYQAKEQQFLSRPHRCRRDCALKLPSVKSLQMGGFDPSHPGGNATGWQHWRIFVGASVCWKASGLSCSDLNAQPRSLIRMSPRPTEGRHHFASAIHKFSEAEATMTVGPLQVASRNERVQ